VLKPKLILSLFVLMGSLFTSAEVSARSYRASDGTDVVKDKLFPKRKSLEISPRFGLILNQSYVDSVLTSLGVNYYMSEEWGFGLDLTLAINSDKTERTCIESFYNDPGDDMSEVCNPDPTELIQVRDQYGQAGSGVKEKPNYGPAYVPVREIGQIISVNALWNPVYGKQLIFKSFISHFDLFLESGGAIVISKYYPKRNILANSLKARGEKLADSDLDGNIGATPEETYAWGLSGRPPAQDKANVALNLGIGQKFHFGALHFNLLLRNMLILGTPSGFESLFAFSTGLGVRF